mgnify:CR=1 FL=1
MTHTIHNGNNIDILKTYPDNHFDAVVTDPPYGIEFLGKDWDKNTGAVDSWAECFIPQLSNKHRRCGIRDQRSDNVVICFRLP